jgi:hypothetical protein
MEILQIPNLRSPVMVIAFSVGMMQVRLQLERHRIYLEHGPDPEFDVVPELIAEADIEEFYDFQANRPLVYIDDSSIRNLTWPELRFYALQTPELPVTSSLFAVMNHP